MRHNEEYYDPFGLKENIAAKQKHSLKQFGRKMLMNESRVEKEIYVFRERGSYWKRLTSL